MTKAHGSTLYLGSKEMALMISLLEDEYGRSNGAHDHQVKCRKMIDKLRSKQYHPTRKK